MKSSLLAQDSTVSPPLPSAPFASDDDEPAPPDSPRHAPARASRAAADTSEALGTEAQTVVRNVATVQHPAPTPLGRTLSSVPAALSLSFMAACVFTIAVLAAVFAGSAFAIVATACCALLALPMWISASAQVAAKNAVVAASAADAIVVPAEIECELNACVRERGWGDLYPPAAITALAQRLTTAQWDAIVKSHRRASARDALCLARLALVDIVIFVDDSGSMAHDTRILDAEAIASHIAGVATIFDDDGINVRFINSTLPRGVGDGVRTASDATAVFAAARFQGGTNIGTELERKVRLTWSASCSEPGIGVALLGPCGCKGTEVEARVRVKLVNCGSVRVQCARSAPIAGRRARL